MKCGKHGERIRDMECDGHRHNKYFNNRTQNYGSNMYIYKFKTDAYMNYGSTCIRVSKDFMFKQLEIQKHFE